MMEAKMNAPVDMSVVAKQVMELERRIADAETQAASLRGQREELLRRLQAEFGVTTLEQAETLLKQLEEELNGVRVQVGQVQTQLDGFVAQWDNGRAQG